MSSFAFTTTKWALGLASKLIKADVRMHNLDVIEDDMSIIFVVNHFTRLETIILPYQFYLHMNKEVWSLAAGELFSGRIGRYMQKMGALSTKDPDRDKVIVHSLLKGEHPWIIFPEGQMIKDKKVLDPAGVFSVFNRGERRPPHKGAAILALQAEFYRHKLECIYNSPKQEGLAETQERFNLDFVDKVLSKRTIVIPVNITYFPIRARDNAVLRIASALTKDLSDRALEELSLEGTLLSKDTDIDITLGEPIDVRKYLYQPEYAELMACGDDLSKMETDPKSLFNAAAEKMLPKFMEDIYMLTRVNYDHIFATIIRHQGKRPFTERRYRNRIFLAVHELLSEGKHKMHTLLEKTYRDIIYEDVSTKFNDFIELCIEEKVIHRDGALFRRIPGLKRGKSDFHAVRSEETTYVIANEVEPLEGFTELVTGVAKATKAELCERVRTIFLEEDNLLFNEDYFEFRSKESHAMDIGRPFLMIPPRYKAGIVLVHGYMAAPEEVRAFARYLYDQGYLVYGVRLRGHGTSPEDLALRSWQEWYESLNRGYVIVKSYTDRIILGGFSTGGCLALYGAARKQEKIEAVFSINAPLKLRQVSAKLIPSVVTMTSWLKKIRGPQAGWDYVQNSPENPTINYIRNPLTGVRELGRVMDEMEERLGEIIVPTLVVQGSKDPVVNPDSGPDIFHKVGTQMKELTIFERDRHGIINGEHREDVYDRVYRFLLWAETKQDRVREAFESAREQAVVESTLEAASEA